MARFRKDILVKSVGIIPWTGSCAALAVKRMNEHPAHDSATIADQCTTYLTGEVHGQQLGCDSADWRQYVHDAPGPGRGRAYVASVKPVPCAIGFFGMRIRPAPSTGGLLACWMSFRVGIPMITGDESRLDCVPPSAGPGDASWRTMRGFGYLTTGTVLPTSDICATHPEEFTLHKALVAPCTPQKRVRSRRVA